MNKRILGSALLLACLVAPAAAQPLAIPLILLSEVRAPSPYVYNVDLVANTAETVTAPNFTNLAGSLAGNPIGIFKCPESFLIRIGGTATVPGADAFDGTASERDPTALQFTPGQQFSMISATSQDCSISWGRGLPP